MRAISSLVSSIIKLLIHIYITYQDLFKIQTLFLCFCILIEIDQPAHSQERSQSIDIKERIASFSVFNIKL